MKEPGATMGLFPGAPKNRMGYLDFFMPATSPNGRHNIGTVNLDANELTFAQDGSLTLHLSHEPPTDQAAQANWLPAPDGQFALIGRAYVPTQPLLDATYTLPNVQRL
jgi:hypothetical protein